MTGEAIENALSAFVAPFMGDIVWGAKQGYGSFLDMEFGQPKLIVKEWQSKKLGQCRDAYPRGVWSIWIYCCEWQISARDKQIAWSESPREEISRATRILNGQRLTRVSVESETGRSRFEFDLGGLLETWPTGDDPTEEQWFIYSPSDVFGYRADGRWINQAPDTSRESERWIGEI